MQHLLRPSWMKHVSLLFLAFCGQWEHVESGSNKHGFIASKLFLSFFIYGKGIAGFMQETILQKAAIAENWQQFLDYKIQKQHLSYREENEIRDFIERKAYLALCSAWERGQYPLSLPVKRIVNKEGARKKRIVYSFCGDEGIFLKFIAFYLYQFDGIFCSNCYAFRRGLGARNAIRRLKEEKVETCYCLKVDISNYFNSIHEEKLLAKLEFIKEQDLPLYHLFEKILLEDRVREGGKIIHEKHGAMAGTPISPFLANVYLRDMDEYFQKEETLYFRYSDDILLFAHSREELEQKRERLYDWISRHELTVNPEKVTVYAPGEKIEFLGFCYHNGEIDLSANTIRKTKAKIKRKADALRRWQRKKNLSGEKAAVGFIRAMNHKFFGNMDSEWGEDEFTWNRWFFPNLTVDTGLKEIDAYLQQYIRYIVTGRHYKGNYRIRYETIKQWGYRSLVHEYYEWKKCRKSR